MIGLVNSKERFILEESDLKWLDNLDMLFSYISCGNSKHCSSEVCPPLPEIGRRRHQTGNWAPDANDIHYPWISVWQLIDFFK